METENNIVTALVILNFNDADTTVMSIRRAINIPFLNHIVIVDNGSTDGSTKTFQNILKKISDGHIHLLTAPKNGGYAYGNNLGCRYAIENLHATHVFIANPDAIFDAQAVKKIISVYMENADAAIVSALMNTLSGVKLSPAWKLPKYTDCLQECFVGFDRFCRRANSYKAEYLGSASVVPVDVINGSFFCISSAAYEIVGGFDERTFLYYEENILAARLKNTHFQNYLLTAISYTHEHQKTINKNLKGLTKKFNILEKSRELYCHEYLHCNEVQILLLKIVYRLGLVPYVLIKRYKGV